MAVRTLDTAKLKVNVEMKDGREFLGCDVPSQPLGSSQMLVGFWYNGAIRMVPLQDVLHVDFYEEDANDISNSQHR